MVENESDRSCPCGSGKSYSSCCQPYHKEEVFPASALALMRSRYAAYALGLVDYIIATTHPKNPSFCQEREIFSFCQNTRFEGLEILEFVDGEQEAFVTFRASLLQEERDVSFVEKSRFQKVDERWLYRDGKVDSKKVS